MCNTRSNVYLQSMKTYTLSVNTLTWNLTSEHHDNCAPCLGSNTSYTVGNATTKLSRRFTSSVMIALSSHLVCLQHLFDFTVYLRNFELVFVYISVFCPLQHSLIAMSSFLNLYWSKWMWSDPNLFCASTSNSICPNHMHSIETYQLSSLSPCQHKT